MTKPGTSKNVESKETETQATTVLSDRSTAVIRDGVTVLTDSPRSGDEHVQTVQEKLAEQVSKVGGKPSGAQFASQAHAAGQSQPGPTGTAAKTKP